MNYLLKVIKLKSIIREKPFRLANLAPVSLPIQGQYRKPGQLICLKT
jgi:hypothetical protein